MKSAISSIVKNNMAFYAITGIILLSLAFGIFQYSENKRYKEILNDVYAVALYDAEASLEDIVDTLNALSILDGEAAKQPYYSRLWRQSNAAGIHLSRLPRDSAEVTGQTALINGLSIFAEKKTRGEITAGNDDSGKLNMYKQYADALANDLSAISSRLRDGALSAWDAPDSGYPGIADGSALLGSISVLTEDFDGYSKEVAADTPGASGLDPGEITIAEGAEIVRAFVSPNKPVNIIYFGENNGVSPASLSYGVSLKESGKNVIYMDITKKVGVPLWLLCTDQVDGAIIDVKAEAEADGAKKTYMEQARLARSFLRERGYAPMRAFAYEPANGAVFISFAPISGGVTVYPEAVVVKVSEGESIIGFEATSSVYARENTKRAIPPNIIPIGTAKASLSKAFHVASEGLCFIESPTGESLFCYEISGELGGTGYTVFINAENGTVELVRAE